MAADADRLRSAGLRATPARLPAPDGSSARYAARVGDNQHHHIACRRCGAVADCVVSPAPCLAPGSHGFFSVGEAEVTFWGLCAQCRQAPPDPPAEQDNSS